MTLQIDPKRLIGMDENQASRLVNALGGHMSVVRRDTFPEETITDVRTDRVLTEVKNGRIIRASIG